MREISILDRVRLSEELIKLARAGDLTGVKQLLEAGINPNYEMVLSSEIKHDYHYSGSTAFNSAYASGHGSTKTIETKGTALTEAAKHNHLPIVRLLVNDYKADVNLHSPMTGTTDPNIVRILIENKASVEQRKTTFDLAMTEGRLAVLKLLVEEYKMVVDLKDSYYSTPTYEDEDIKTYRINALGGHADCLRFLFQSKALRGFTNDANDQWLRKSLFWYAVYANSIDSVKILLENKISTNFMKASKYGDPLFEAVSGKKEEVACLLIAGGADVNYKSKYNDKGRDVSVLHKAIQAGCSGKVIRALINKGANLNARMQIERSPGAQTCMTMLMFFTCNFCLLGCCCCDHFELYETLTPLEYARRKQHEEAVSILSNPPRRRQGSSVELMPAPRGISGQAEGKQVPAQQVMH